MSKAHGARRFCSPRELRHSSIVLAVHVSICSTNTLSSPVNLYVKWYQPLKNPCTLKIYSFPKTQAPDSCPAAQTSPECPQRESRGQKHQPLPCILSSGSDPSTPPTLLYSRHKLFRFLKLLAILKIIVHQYYCTQYCPCYTKTCFPKGWEAFCLSSKVWIQFAVQIFSLLPLPPNFPRFDICKANNILGKLYLSYVIQHTGRAGQCCLQGQDCSCLPLHE